MCTRGDTAAPRPEVRQALAGTQFTTERGLWILLGGDPDDFGQRSLAVCAEQLRLHGYVRRYVSVHPLKPRRLMWVREEAWPEDEQWPDVQPDDPDWIREAATVRL